MNLVADILGITLGVVVTLGMLYLAYVAWRNL